MLLRDTILLVDPSTSSRGTLRKLFESRFNILEASSLTQAELLLKHNLAYIAAILLDINLIAPGEISAFREMAEAKGESLIPLIAIVDEDDVQGEHRAFQMGAVDIVFRPYHSVTAEHRVINLIDLYRSRWTLADLVEEQSMTLRHTNEVMVDALSSIIECRSVESGQHILRIRRFTQILLGEVARCCPEYGLTERSIQSISSAAALHDIGKIAIPDAILNKPGALTAEEFETMKTHTTSGSDILQQMDVLGNEEYLRYAYNICRYHHERWTGKGYPEGLSGNEIPICAQVVGLADAYDALTTDRVYKKAYSCVQATNMILNGDCGEFSPKLLECFKHVKMEFAELAEAYTDGYSPKSDAISAPLPPPKPGAANSLQALLAKHTALIHHLNAIVMEVDVEERTYHLTYNPDPDFAMLSGATSLDSAITLWSQGMYDGEGKAIPPQRLLESLEKFLASGSRERSFHNLLHGMDGRLHPYRITLLRPDSEVKTNKAIILWEKEDMADAPEQDNSSASLKRALTGLLGISQVMCYDHRLTLEKTSPGFTNLLGYTAEELDSQFQNRLIELVPISERETVLSTLRQQLRHGTICEVEIPLLRKDGKLVWMVFKGVLASDQAGRELIYGVVVDVSYTRESQEALRAVLNRQQIIMDQSSDIIFELDFEADRLSCSSKWEERFGYKPISENISARVASSSHFHPDDIPIFVEKMDQLRAGVSFVEFTVRVSDSTGHYLWSRVRATLQRDNRGRPAKAVGVFIDIDDELRTSWALMANADRDSLTKLLNKEACRREVENHLSQSNGTRLSAMAIIDLDNFKEVNDRFGHLFGDTILTRISSEINRTFRGTDVVARIGGDEFMVFMPEIPNQKLAQDRFQVLIESVKRMLKEHTSIESLSCSVGIAFAPDHGTVYEELFQRADRALYQAKSLGKNRYCCFTGNSIESFPTMISKRIDSEIQPGMAGDSLIQFFFERLYESGDMEGTIQSLLEIAGTEMEVSRVYIFENNADNTTCSNTFEWCNKGIEPEIHNLQNVSYETDIPNYQSVFNERGIFYCPDVTQLPQDLRDILEPQGIKSVLHCAIRDRGQFRGYVGFDENTKIRMWTQEQIDLLTFLSQLVSVFLLKQRAQDRADRMVHDLRNVLDNQYAWTYVVEPDTYRLRFLNEKTLKVAPEARVGESCYRALMGRDTPCEVCPIREESGKCRVTNEYLSLEVDAFAHPIHWEGEDAWLLTCREVDEQS